MIAILIPKNAYITINGRDGLDTYIESKNQNKPLVNEKIERIKNILKS